MLNGVQSLILHASDWYSSLAPERGPIDHLDKRGAITASEYLYSTTLRDPAGKQGVDCIAIGGTTREFVKAAKFICSLENKNGGRSSLVAQDLGAGVADLANHKRECERRARE